MRRVAGVGIGLCLLVASLFAFGPVSSAIADPAGVSAGYRLHIDMDGQGYTRELMTLLENHTGYTDLDWIAWSRDGKQITLAFTNRLDHSYEATYVGRLVRGGISTRRHPGTITGASGDTGIFYAVNKTS
jgi:hypothetical protein